MNQKIRDEARKKIGETVTYTLYDDFILTEDDGLDVADQILSLSGETDEVCSRCNGEKQLTSLGRAGKRKGYAEVKYRCYNCTGTGTIKKKWHIEIVEEE